MATEETFTDHFSDKQAVLVLEWLGLRQEITELSHVIVVTYPKVPQAFGLILTNTKQTKDVDC